MKKTIFLLVLIIGIASCKQEETYNYIPTEYKTTLQSNEKIYFQDSLTNKVDTFKIDVDDYYYITDGKRYDEAITVIYNGQNNDVKFKKIYVDIELHGISIRSVRDNIGGISFISPENNVFKENVKINNVIYPKVYIVQNKYNFPDSIPQTVYYTFKNGIIRYEYKDGRKYKLINIQ